MLEAYYVRRGFRLRILYIECLGMLMVSAIILPIVLVKYLLRQDDAYAARLRRKEVPANFALVSVDDGSPQPEST
jgi:hypothetical protein